MRREGLESRSGRYRGSRATPVASHLAPSAQLASDEHQGDQERASLHSRQRVSLGFSEGPFLSVKLQVCQSGSGPPSPSASWSPPVAPGCKRLPWEHPHPCGERTAFRFSSRLTLDACIMETAPRDPSPELPGAQGDRIGMGGQCFANVQPASPQGPPFPGWRGWCSGALMSPLLHAAARRLARSPSWPARR